MNIKLLKNLLIAFLFYIASCKDRKSSNSELRDIEYNGRKYANTINLEKQFTEVIAQQQIGSCHIHSAVALVEAACFRATDKHIDISEDYLTYRHLRTELGKHQIIKLDSLQNTNIRGMLFDAKIEGGRPAKTVERILNKSVCTEQEFAFDEGFIKFLRSSIQNEFAFRQEIAEKFDRMDISKETRDKLIYQEQQLHDSRIKETLCSKLDSKVKCAISNPKDSNGNGYFTYTQDDELKSCMNSNIKANVYQNLDAELFRELGLVLLNRNLPFICTTEIKYKNGDTGPHALVFLGYKYDSKSNGNISFLVRDSNRYTLQWAEGTCSEVVAISQGNEILPKIK